MKKILFPLIILLPFFTHAQVSSNNDSTIILSEIMFAGKSGDNEFIELYNLSDSISVDLENFQIKYYNSNPDVIIDAGMGTILKPKSFAVIFEGDYDFANGIYKDIVPDSVLIMKISDNAFGTRGMSNSSDRTIQLITPADILLEEYTYSANNSKGISDEKILLNKDTSASNWENSKVDNGTPGFRNSVTPINYDPGIATFTSEDDYRILGSPEKFNITVKNYGALNSNNYQLKIYFDSNKDSTAQTSEEIASFSGMTIASGDSAKYDFTFSGFSEGNNLFIAKLESQNDENLSNNLAEINLPAIKLNEFRKDIVINEIMYAPEPGMPEWFEIFNNSNKTIELKNYQAADNSDTTKINTANISMNPNEFLVVSADSSILNYFNVKSKIIISNFPTLNNSGDKIILLDSLNRVIDSLQYSPDWGGDNGFSLERISYSGNSCDSTNWRTSLNTNKATPGNVNSVIDLKPYSKNDLIVNEIMFDPAPYNSEFIELYNTGNKEIDLGGWYTTNANSEKIYLSNVRRIIKPNSYFVIAADSSILNNYEFSGDSIINILDISSLGLSNNSDLIIIKDATGNTIDSVQYFESWHNSNFINTQNKSLEKINPYLSGNDKNNWSTSANINGATPGKQNSIFTTSPNNAASVSVSPNPFSPDNDGFEDFTIIKYSINQPVVQMNVKIFDSHGRLVRTIKNNSATGSNGSVVFDGLDDNKNPLRIGIYIALIEVLNAKTGNTEKIKTPVVVAKKF